MTRIVVILYNDKSKRGFIQSKQMPEDKPALSIEIPTQTVKEVKSDDDYEDEWSGNVYEELEKSRSNSVYVPFYRTLYWL